MSDVTSTELETTDEGTQPQPKESARRQEITSEDLQRMLDQERRRSRQAEAEARAAREELATERGARKTDVEARYESDLNSAKQAVAAATAEADRYQTEADAHFAEGRWSDGTKAMRLAAKAEAASENARGRQEWLEKNKDSLLPKAPVGRAEPSRRASGGEVELDWSKYTRKQRDWIEDHPDYFRNDNRGQAYRNRVAALHFEALDAGHDEDSRDYFDFIDAGLGGGREPPRQARQETDDMGEREPFQGSRAPAQMPVQRSAGARQPARNDPRGGSVTLTPEQREAADAAMPDVPRNDYRDKDGNTQPGRYRIYAEQMVRMRKEGRLH